MVKLILLNIDQNDYRLETYRFIILDTLHFKISFQPDELIYFINVWYDPISSVCKHQHIQRHFDIVLFTIVQFEKKLRYRSYHYKYLLRWWRKNITVVIVFNSDFHQNNWYYLVLTRILKCVYTKFERLSISTIYHLEPN